MAKKSQTSTSQNENSRHGSSAIHTRLVKDTLIALGRANLGIFWRNEVGMALNPRTEEPFSYGFAGSPDIIGFSQGGYFFGFECKTGNAKLNETQRVFFRVAEKYQAKVFEVRSDAEAVNLLFSTLNQLGIIND